MNLDRPDDRFSPSSLFYHRSQWKTLVCEGIQPVLDKYDIQEYLFYLSLKRGDHITLMIDKRHCSDSFFTFIESHFYSFFKTHPSEESNFDPKKSIFLNAPNNILQFKHPYRRPHRSEALEKLMTSMSSISLYYLSQGTYSPQLILFLYTILASLYVKEIFSMPKKDLTALFLEQFESFRNHATDFNVSDDFLETNHQKIKGLIRKNLTHIMALTEDHIYSDFSREIQLYLERTSHLTIFDQLALYLKTISTHLDISDLKQLVYGHCLAKTLKEIY